jgi:type I restriction enzyme M protein
MKPDTGRCAILFPHGILFRGEETDMRKKLVESDLVECVIGIGKNLFFNSPMDACIVICRTNKPIDRRSKVLFINARNEVTRKNAESYLEDSHIEKIASVYHEFKVVNGFSAIADIETILRNDGKLSIALYVTNADDGDQEKQSFDDAIAEWMTGYAEMRETYEDLCNMLPEESI